MKTPAATNYYNILNFKNLFVTFNTPNYSLPFNNQHMKTLPFLTMLILFLFTAITKTNAQKSEDDAIKKVIQQETSTYFHKNYDGWADTWAHDSAVCVVRVSNSGHSETMGWN